MNAFLKMTWIEVKLFFREPVGLFFTLVFPLILLFVFGAIFGNEPTDLFGGFGNVDASLPGYIGMIIGTIGLIGLPINLANYRERGILRRLRSTPVQAGTILGAQVAISILLLLVGVALLVGSATLVYQLRFPGAKLAIIPAMILSGVSFFALGFVLAGLMPTARTAQAAGMAILFPMLFLSGAAMPRQIMPESIRRVAEFLPLTHVVILLEDLWFRATWNWTALAGVVGLLLISLVVSMRTFRWT